MQEKVSGRDSKHYVRVNVHAAEQSWPVMSTVESLVVSRLQLVARRGQSMEPLPDRAVHCDHDRRHDNG